MGCFNSNPSDANALPIKKHCRKAFVRTATADSTLRHGTAAREAREAAEGHDVVLHYSLSGEALSKARRPHGTSGHWSTLAPFLLKTLAAPISALHAAYCQLLPTIPIAHCPSSKPTSHNWQCNIIAACGCAAV